MLGNKSTIFFFCLLFLLEGFSLCHSQELQEAFGQNLPPSLVFTQLPYMVFSGFRNTVAVNLNTSTSETIIPNLEESCSLSPNDLPFYSRLFIHEIAGTYYYCPKNRSLLVLNPNKNFTITSSINLSKLPAFDEVRLKIFITHPGVITMIGITNEANTKDSMAKNYTESYMVLISWQLKVVTSTVKIKGAHGEPIIEIEAIFGKVIAVGEKSYAVGTKLNTYYWGNWGDTQYTKVIDFYLSPFGFLPRIKITTDQQFLIYTSSDALYGYHINTTTIIQTQDSTLVNHTYYKDGRAIHQWQEMPYAVSTLEKKMYSYHQGNLTTYLIRNNQYFIEESTIKLAPFDHGLTYTRFYFFKYLLKDAAFIQIGESSSVVFLSNHKAESFLGKTSNKKELKGLSPKDFIKLEYE